jgi:exonuclease VII large subunit
MNTLQKHLGSIRVWGNNSIRESLHSIRVHEEKARIMDPATILSLGYSITLDGNGVLIRHSGSVKQGDVVTTRVSNGTFESKVL